MKDWYKGAAARYLLVLFVVAVVFLVVLRPRASYAEVLSGANGAVLAREAQQTPDRLGTGSFDELFYADPAAQLDLVQPPVANNQGDAAIEHPLWVPPGRSGVQPLLALAYRSSGDNGWLGLGWDLSVGEVTIDTRWGVPRYDASKETETYLLDGEVLAPTAVRSTLLDRQAERVFQRRVEGQFERVQRHGSGPGSYWWEVTDKSGTRRYYGGTPEGGRDATAILADDYGNGFRWALTQIRDISNNTATFQYVMAAGSGVGLSSAPVGRELYLQSIRYTGTAAAGVTDDPAYEVRFVRAAELGEPRRSDVSVDGRGGFLRVTADLLRRVDVYYRGELARRYILHYNEGAFGKTLLQRVDQAGADGAPFASHTFSYYDDVRPNGTTYNGFAATSRWDTGNDGVGDGIDLGALGDSSASALGGAESLGGDGRAYLGFNLLNGDKDGSVGAGFVFKGEDGRSLLELIDINGDNLVDKVFLEGGQVKYRLNTSGPGHTAAATFGEKRSVAGINGLSEENSFQFGIGPEAYIVANVMYNHAWSWAWGKAYFIDVNTDGLMDFVSGGTVYFNSLDGNGNPVFTLSSGVTAVPIDSGNVDSALLPDLSDIEAEQRAQSPLQDTLRRWRAPWAGTVQVQGDVQLLPPDGDAPTGDGVRVAVQREGTELWSALIDGGDYTPKTPTGVSAIAVNRGDDIYFRLQSRDDGASDEVAWDPLISYLSVSAAVDANGLDIYRYQASHDFTLAGLSGTYVRAPLDGIVRLAGDFEKLRKTTDDITIEILKNGSPAAGPVAIGRDSTGVTPFAAEFAVTSGDELRLRLKIDSPVDLSAFSWAPRLYYLSATDGGEPVPVVDANGKPTLDLRAPVNADIYPGNDLLVPREPWQSTATGSIGLVANVAFCDPQQPVVCLPTDEDGSVVLTVKKKIVPANAGDPPAELVAKQVLTVQDGLVIAANPATLTVDVEENAEYWFDLAVAQPFLAMTWRSAELTGVAGGLLPVVRNWSYIPGDVFPQPYRGWGLAGYNGDEDRATLPVDESRLLFNQDDYPSAAPQPVDPANQYPSYPDQIDPNYKNPLQGKAYVFTPFLEIDESTGQLLGRQWRGVKENIFGSATGAGSSRIGPDSIGLPGSGELLGARAVTRFSITEGDSIAGGIGGSVGGAYAWGTSEGLLDYFDMNGDQFPDIVGRGGVQYTTSRGALEPLWTVQAALSGNVREDSSTSKTLSGGGTAAEISSDSKGDGNTSQDVAPVNGSQRRNSGGNSDTGSADSGDDSQTGVSLGLSGGLGWSSTNTDDDSPIDDLLENELVDMNGDGLPDRVRVFDDGTVTVALNLGYSFSPAVDWPGGSLEQGESFSVSVGPSLGFSSGSLAFSGGVSLSSSDEKSLSTWVDLNGDGLADQLVRMGSSIGVRFNTGAGLTNTVNWGSFQEGEIARSESIGLGGGVDFTIGIGPLCIRLCYIIINPGGHVEGGMSRQELELSDVNGDGYPDHVASDSDEFMDVALNNTGRTNLLRSVSNPLGGTIEVDYAREGNTPVQPFSQWVLSRVAVNDGRSGDGPDVRLTTYEYEDNAFNPLERSFLGYAQVTERQRQAGVAGEPVIRSYERVYRNATIFDNGLLARETLLGPSGPLAETVNEWRLVDIATGNPANLQPDPAGVGLLTLTVFPQRVKSEHRWFDDGAVAKRTWSTFAYDNLGNIVQTVDVGEPDLPDDDLTAFMSYTDCTSTSWVSLPNAFEIRDGNGDALRSRRAELLCENGAVTKLWEDTGSGEALTELAFNAYGSYNHIIYPPNANGEKYEVRYVYDADRRTNIAEVVDSFGLVGSATYHGPTGQLSSQTDANGQVTAYTYDAQGRLATITGPYEQGAGRASVSFEYFPTAPAYAYAVARHYDAFNPADAIDTVSFLDGIGRETQTKQDGTLFHGAGQPAEDVMIVAGAVEFDALGRVVREWYPIEEPLGTIGVYNTNVDSVNPTESTWNLRDQVTQVKAPSGSIIKTEHGFDNGSLFGTAMFRATRTDPLGNVRRVYSDVRENLLAVEVEHDDGTGVQTLQTQYGYNPLQQLIRVVDAAGNETTHTYDTLGRRTATSTPDGGEVAFSYDLASNLVARVTPNLRDIGGQISYTYDFNRLIGVSYPDGTPGVQYEYGAPGAPHNGAGRIVRVEDGARVQLRQYGRQGEVTEETTTMLVHNLSDGTAARLTWRMAFAFDTWGRPTMMTYPDGELVTYDYDAGGLMSSMAGEKSGISYPYIVRQEYDKFMARRFVENGNGVETETRYNAQTRRLERQIIEAPGRRVQDFTYTYDGVGNLVVAENAAPVPVADLLGGSSRQTFVYDDLYRLVSAEGSYDFAPRKRRDYSYDLVYDNVDNILRKSQTDTVFNSPGNGIIQAKTTYDWTYAYAAAPHQPTHIGQQTYTYDLNGNLTGWTDDFSGQNRTVTWDAEDRVSSVADQGSTTQYTYNDKGTLSIERGPQGETAFVNRFYTVHNGTVAWKHFWAGGERVATKRQMPEEELEHMHYFFHKDLLGSTNLVTDADGQVFEYALYFPSGESWVLEHGDIHRVPYLYTGGYFDETRNLYNLGARWYESREQLFYSPDPALVRTPTTLIGDPPLLSAYAYAAANPMRFVDRDGLAPEDVQDAYTLVITQPTAPAEPVDTGRPMRLVAAVVQSTDPQLDTQGGRLVAKLGARGRVAAVGAFRAVANSAAAKVLPANLRRTPDGFGLKDVKVSSSFSRQSTMKKDKTTR